MKKNKYFVYIVLLGIVLLSAILRLWQLNNVPVSLDWDEASWGYNAFSIVETGRDEFGKKLPIIVRSLNDYKPALYMYMIVPFIYLFGLIEVAVRLPNAIAGIFVVFVTYFLVIELFEKRKDLGLLSAFLLAISPWAIQFSRFAHEGMTGLLFNLLMILFFLKSFKRSKFLMISALFAGLSLYSYQNEKVFVPLMLLILLISFYKEFIKIPRKYIFSSFVIGLLMVLPMFFYIITTPESLSRAGGASFLNNPVKVYENRLAERVLIDKENRDLLGLVFDNRRVVYAKAIAGNYLSHFDPNFLFLRGDELIGRHQPPNMGHLYLIELPFLLLGLYFIIFGKFKRSIKIFMFLWILITPIAAAITWDVPNSGRTINFLPTFQIITAIGIISFYQWLMKLKVNNLIKYSLLCVIGTFATFNFIFYINQYFVQYKFFNSQDWQYGYKEVVGEAENIKKNYDKVIVSDNYPMDQSYIFFLFYTKYPPSLYQNRANKESKDFDKFEFRRMKEKENLKNTIYIAAPNQIPWDYNKDVLYSQNYLNGDEAMVIVKSN